MVEVIVEYEERIRAQERRPDGLLAKHAYSVLQVQSSVMDREAVFGLSYIGLYYSYWVVCQVLCAFGQRLVEATVHYFSLP